MSTTSQAEGGFQRCIPWVQRLVAFLGCNASLHSLGATPYPEYLELIRASVSSKTALSSLLSKLSFPTRSDPFRAGAGD